MEKWKERESIGWVILFLSLGVCVPGLQFSTTVCLLQTLNISKINK